MGAAATHDGGLVVFTGVRLAKVTFSQAKGATLVTKGLPLPFAPLEGAFAVFPYRSGDTVVQRVGKSDAWLYSKGALWTPLVGDPARSLGVVQGGTAFWMAEGGVWADDLSRYRASSQGGRRFWEGVAHGLVPTDRDDRVCYLVGEDVYDSGLGLLGPWPGPGAVVVHDPSGKASFVRLGAGGRLVFSH
jgi:hypothetical protein